MRQCVDSIIEQSFSDFELILVNDGSNDSCPGICDGYAKKDSRVIVIHQENGGSSYARNSGIAAASGDYLMFVDSDDYITEGSFEKISQDLKQNKGCDVFFLNSAALTIDGSSRSFGYPYSKDKIFKKCRSEVLSYFEELSEYPVSAPLKLMRRQLVLDKELFFTSGIVCEDLDQMISLLLNAQTFDVCPSLHYIYRCSVPNSISSSQSGRLFESLLQIMRKWQDPTEQNKFIYRLMAFEYVPLLWYYHKLNKVKKKEYKAEMHKHAVLMSYSKDKRVLVVYLVYKLLKLRAAAWLVNLYYTLKLGKKAL